MWSLHVSFIEFLGVALFPIILRDRDVLCLFPVDIAVFHHMNNMILKRKGKLHDIPMVCICAKDLYH